MDSQQIQSKLSPDDAKSALGLANSFLERLLPQNPQNQPQQPSQTPQEGSQTPQNAPGQQETPQPDMGVELEKLLEPIAKQLNDISQEIKDLKLQNENPETK